MGPSLLSSVRQCVIRRNRLLLTQCSSSIICHPAVASGSTKRISDHSITQRPASSKLVTDFKKFSTQTVQPLPNFKDNKADLVIFDKDGTLVCFHTLWSIFAIHLAKHIEVETGLNVTERIYQLLGYCNVTNKYSASVFTDGTNSMVRHQIEGLLKEKGLTEERAQEVIKKHYGIALAEAYDTEKNVKPLDDLVKLFSTLKSHGIKIAMCTADIRLSALRTVAFLGLTKYIDMSVCGDDVDSIAKPSPHNAKLICNRLQVDPSRAVMVGDSVTDVGMARLALLGGSVGVSTGTTVVEDLLPHADVVLDRLMDLIPLIIPSHEMMSDTGHTSSKMHAGKYNSASSLGDMATLLKTNKTHQARGLCTSSIGLYNTHRRYCSMSNNNSSNIGKQQLFSQRRSFSVHSQEKQTYDYVIVGAGSAGCVLANRISANKSNKVLVLEAGPPDNSWTIHMPAALMYNLCDDKYNWFYHTTPQKNMNNRVMYWPRGRVWGGSSSLNAMVYIRGHALDYDRWQKEGAERWSYADCLPYFRKAQTHELGPDDYRGGDGPLHVSRGKTNNPLFKAFIEAGMEAGYPYTSDMNGYQQEGLGYMDMTIHQGKRWSAASAYLRPAIHRANLDIHSRAFVQKIVFDGTTAVGLQYEHEGLMKEVRFNKDLILSGGAINSPQLLMLSGVGNADDLTRLEIPVVQHLPGVGENLQDHLEVYVQQECTQPITLYSAQWKFPHKMAAIGLEWFTRSTGWGASTHLEAGGFIRSRPGVEHPDIQFHFLPSTVNDHGRKSGDRHAYQVHVGPMRPTSRGYLKLQSRSPLDHPVIEPNYLSTEMDRSDMVQNIRLAREIFGQKAFEQYRGAEIAPGADIQTDDQIHEFARNMCDSAYHPSCTCKMGSTSDKMAVVDSTTRVIGLDKLRVVDASIMPSVVSGNLNGPTIMLAEKAADIILGNTPLPRSNAPVWHPKTLETQRTMEGL